MPAQSPGGSDSRVLAWAAACGQVRSPSGFAARLNGSQTAAEILNIFRETPEFGRSLATRIEPFLDETAEGSLRLIGGGGEAAVWYEESSQSVVKLFAPPCKARFGWIMECDAAGQWSIRPGGLAEAILRFALFENLFPSGLELEECGPGGEYLTLRQPFIAGHHPDTDSLHAWMTARGWQPCPLPSDLPMLQNLTWQRGPCLATDVRPENALISDTTGIITAIDFICGAMPDHPIGGDWFSQAQRRK